MIDFKEVNMEGLNGFDVAKEKGHSAIVEMLTKAGLEAGPKVLFLDACKNAREDDLRKTLLEREDIVKSCGAKEFHEACQNGNEVTVKWFLQECQGLVDFNSKDKNGMTGFINACWKGHISVVNLLLEQPNGIIDITAKNSEGAGSTVRRHAGSP